MKGLGVIIQDSDFKTAFQLCEGNFSVMLLGEVVAGQLSQPQSPRVFGRWQPRLGGTGVFQAAGGAVGAALLQGVGECVQGALQGHGGCPSTGHFSWQQGVHPRTGRVPPCPGL